MDRLQREAHAYVEQLGHATTDTNVYQMRILLQAFEKFVERNAEYDDLWKGDNAAEQATQLRHKALRVYSKLQQVPALTGGEQELDNIIDNTIDGINYAVFTIRKLKGA
jgi:hypothetical protein